MPLVETELPSGKIYSAPSHISASTVVVYAAIIFKLVVIIESHPNALVNVVE